MRLEFLALPWWVVLVLAVLAGWALLRLRRAETVRLPRVARIGVATLRVAAVVVLAAALGEPALGWTSSRTEPPAVAVVIDRSGSMAITDPACAPGVRLDEALALGLIEPAVRPVTAARAARLATRAAAGHALAGDAAEAHELATALAGDPTLAAALTRIAEALANGHPAVAGESGRDAIVRAQRDQADADAALVSGAGAATPLGQALARLAGLPRRERALLLAERLATRLPGAAVDWFVLDERLVPVDGPGGARAALAGDAGTDLGEGLAQLARGWAGRGHPAAVLLLSDGRRTAGADPDPAARALAARGAPLLAIAVGDPAPPPDPAVMGLDAPAEVVAGEPLRLVATVRVPPDAGAWELAWVREGAEVARQAVTAAEGWQRIAAEFPAGAAGVVLWEARLQPARGSEAAAAHQAVVANDAAARAVAVAAAPPRLLAIDIAPRWEMRHAIAALETGLTAKVDRRYRSVIGRGPALLPDQAGLDAYDGLILGDLPPSELGPDGQARIAAFVADRGGFLAVVAGPRAMPSAYGLGPLATVLPLRSGAIAPGDEVEAGAASGPSAAALPIAPPDAADWAGLPPLRWWLRGATVRPGADVVLVARDRAASPLVAAWRHGSGRVVVFASDELWRWRASGDGTVHAALWQRAARWGLGARLTGPDPRLQVALDRAIAVPGEPIELRLRASGDDGVAATTPPAVWIERVGTTGSRRDLAPVAVVDQPGGWTAQANEVARPLPTGRWRFNVDDRHGRSESREALVRADPGRESLETALDRAGLDRIAAAAGGRAVGMDEVDAAVETLARSLSPSRVEVRRRLTPWDGPWWVLALAALLLAEWTWRRKAGLP